MKSKLSIIVPVYNVEKYINKCIDSILAQTFTDFELILVDDGSLDTCGIICDEYAKVDSRIKVIHKKNGGLSSARNAGIDIAKGEYIGFIDSDDLIKDDMYDSLYKAILKHNADISICNFIKFNENSQCIFKKNMNEDMEVWTNIEALEKLNTDPNGKITVVWNKLYKKELWDNIRFPEGKIHEDVFTIHKILFRANKIINTNKSLYGYLQRNSSIIGSGFSLNNLDYIEALEETLNFFKKMNNEYLYNITTIRYIDNLKKYYFKCEELLEDNEEILRKIKNSYNKTFKKYICNSSFGVKNKLIGMFFFINPRVYKIIQNLRGKQVY